MLLVESSIAYFLMFIYLQIIKMEIKLENLLDLVYHWSLRPHQGASSLLILQLAMQEGGNDEDDEREELMPPEEIGEQAASMLLGEIEQGGVVDSRHQGLLFLLCALCPQDVSKVRVGKLSPYAIETLRHIRDFLGVKFVITPDPSTETVILKCLGCGLKNLSRKFS